MFGTLFPEQKIKSFTIYFEEEGDIDERPFANAVVSKYKNIEPYYFSPSANEIGDAFEKVAYHADVPVLGSSYMSQYFLMKLAKQNGVTVVLDGQGSDEYLGGYLHSFYRLLASQIKNIRPAEFLQTFSNHTERENFTSKRKLDILLKSAASLFNDEKGIYNLEYNQYSYLFNSKHSLQIERKSNDKLDDFLYHLLFETTLQTLLHFEDRNSMAFSLESRVPFLDHRLVEFAFELRNEDKINNKAETKYILRESLKSILPQAIYERKDKKGFVTPGEVKWLNKPLRHLLDINFSNLEFLNTTNAKKILDDYKKGDLSNAKMVWKIASINHWIQKNT
jgi:asparagine synthase (glutamine-hydrolysing)